MVYGIYTISKNIELHVVTHKLEPVCQAASLVGGCVR